MDDRRRGDLTGSLKRLSRDEAKRHLRSNSAARRVRRGPPRCLLRFLLSNGSFGRFAAAYLVVDATALCLEVLTVHLAPSWIPPWTAPGPSPDVKTLVLNVSGALVGSAARPTGEGHSKRSGQSPGPGDLAWRSASRSSSRARALRQS